MRPTRLLRAVRSSAAAAVSAQFSQAWASFVLAAMAARALGAAGFGRYALLTGWIVLLTGLMTGVVGDSLTVLDRAAPRVRVGLQQWCALIALVTLVGAPVGSWATGALGPRSAAAFGLAAATWVVEDTARRLLMASLRFWSVVLVDLSHLATAGLLLGLLWAHGLSVTDFLLALVAGQAVGIVVALIRLPPAERWVARGPGAFRAVAAFGLWRGGQQMIRPATLNAMRVLVVLAAGSAAFGRLEAARVYMSPALLMVQGIGSFLLARYAADRHRSLRRSVRRADTAAGVLVLASLALGAVAAATVGWLAPVLTGGSFAIDPLAVASWAAYSASVAAVMPYASLAAVRGRQARVVLYRLLDSSVSVAAVLAVVLLAGVSVSWAPLALATGSLVGAVLQRSVAVRSGRETEDRTGPAQSAAAPVPAAERG